MYHKQVTGFDILDGPILQPCNCTTSTTTGCNPYDIDCGIHPPGTVFGACPGGNNNDYVKIQMNVDFLVSTTRYDVGMYVALDGGSALNGDSCQISSLVHGTFGDVTVWDVEGDASRPNPAPDNCLDLGSPGVMESYPFSPMIMSCTDSNGDGLLDFDIGIVWSVKRGDYDCDIDNLDKRPVASSSPKCWYDENVRATIPSELIYCFVTVISTLSILPSHEMCSFHCYFSLPPSTIFKQSTSPTLPRLLHQSRRGMTTEKHP